MKKQNGQKKRGVEIDKTRMAAAVRLRPRRCRRASLLRSSQWPGHLLGLRQHRALERPHHWAPLGVCRPHGFGDHRHRDDTMWWQCFGLIRCLTPLFEFLLLWLLAWGKRHKTLVITNITLYMMVTPATCACWHFSVSNSMSVQCHEVKSKRIDEWCLEVCFPIQLVSHVKVRSAPQITRSHKVRRPAKMHRSSRLTKTILQAAANHRKEFLQPLGEKLGYLCLIVISILCTVCSKNPLVQISAGKSWSNCLIWGLHLSNRQTERIIAKTSVRRVSGHLSSQAGSTRF